MDLLSPMALASIQHRANIVENISIMNHLGYLVPPLIQNPSLDILNPDLLIDSQSGELAYRSSNQIPMERLGVNHAIVCGTASHLERKSCCSQ